MIVSLLLCFYSCKEISSKCIIDDFTGSLKTLQSLPVAHRVKTYILNIVYDVLSDLTSACYVIFKWCHLLSHFLHSSYLGLLLSLENTILLSIPGPLNTLLSFSELLLSPPFSVLLYFSLYPNSIKNNLLFGTEQDVIRQLFGCMQKNKLTVLSFYSLLLVLGPRIITAGFLEDTAVFIHHLFTHFFGTHLFSALGKHCWIQLFKAWMWAGWLPVHSAPLRTTSRAPPPPPQQERPGPAFEG